MTLERLGRNDVRLIAICAVVAAISLFVGTKYFFLAFPEASIEFKTTRRTSLPVAERFLTGIGQATDGYRHAAVFGFDDEAKIFLERELGVEEAGRLAERTERLWRWKHRWFRPLQKEEMRVEVTTKGEIVGFEHLMPEEAEGPDLAAEEARRLAEDFLATTMGRSLDELGFIEEATQKRPRRTDHTFTWMLQGSEVKGADYRIEIGIAGDRAVSYREYLKVPDTWRRDYAKLRSKNEITGQADTVLMLLTGVAMLVILVQRLMRADVRWRTAGVFGVISFLLTFFSSLNSLPADMYGYDTTVSHGGFLLERIALAGAGALSVGAAIFLITLAAEPLYRARFPRFLSLTALIRPRALRTKEAFIALLVGITLTLFFFAYENVFYIIAHSLGAWSPRDVPYSDLLSTAFPWFFVLLIGWLPAVSEEFISRMFSIPFFEKFFRSRTFAILLSAFIWGFGHAAYPNQPFWIRGLEVGIVGIVFGLVMFRYGIASVLVCHFSVDALYTAFVLIRSDSIYYVVSGALSAGVCVILLAVAAVAYLARGGFIAGETTNEADSQARAGGPADLAAPEPEQEGARAGVPAGPPALEVAMSYRPLGMRRIAIGLAVAAALAGLRALPIERFGDWVDFAATPQRASGSAAAFLRGCGFDVSRYESVADPVDLTDPTAAAYLVRQDGLAGASRVYSEMIPTPLWKIRRFMPGEHEEFAVFVDPRDGSVTGFRRVVPDEAPGPALDESEARLLGESFVAARGLDPARGELKEQAAEEMKARRDHKLVWEYDIPQAGEARIRHEVAIQGDRVGSWTRSVKIPERWERERTRETVLTTALRWLKLPYLGILAGLAMILFIKKIRRGEVPWRFALATGALSGLAFAVLTAMRLDRIWIQGYRTEIDPALFRGSVVIILIVAGILFALAGVLVAGLAGALHPAVTSAWRSESRRRYSGDALVAGLVCAGFAAGLPALAHLVALLVPSSPLVSGISFPDFVSAAVPLLGVLAALVYRTVFLSALGGIAVSLLTIHFRSALSRVALGAFFVLAFLPSAAREPLEYVQAAASLLIVLAGLVVLAKFFLRDNPLAWIWSAWFAPGVITALHLYEQSAPVYRWTGLAATALILLSGLPMLFAALRGAAAAARSNASPLASREESG